MNANTIEFMRMRLHGQDPVGVVENQPQELAQMVEDRLQHADEVIQRVAQLSIVDEANERLHALEARAQQLEEIQKGLQERVQSTQQAFAQATKKREALEQSSREFAQLRASMDQYVSPTENKILAFGTRCSSIIGHTTVSRRRK